MRSYARGGGTELSGGAENATSNPYRPVCICSWGRPGRIVTPMENVDVDFVLRVTIALLVITSPFDPVKLLFFNQVVESGAQHRATAAAKLGSALEAANFKFMAS